MIWTPLQTTAISEALTQRLLCAKYRSWLSYVSWCFESDPTQVFNQYPKQMYSNKSNGSKQTVIKWHAQIILNLSRIPNAWSEVWLVLYRTLIPPLIYILKPQIIPEHIARYCPKYVEHIFVSHCRWIIINTKHHFTDGIRRISCWR
jgi:hypothetical protein